MLPLVDITESVIEVRKWVGGWLEMLLEEDVRLEGWVFQREGGERLIIQDLDEGFQEGLGGLQAGGEGLIPAGVDTDKDMSLRRSLRKESTTEVLSRGLYALVIEDNNK